MLLPLDHLALLLLDVITDAQDLPLDVEGQDLPREHPQESVSNDLHPLLAHVLLLATRAGPPHLPSVGHRLGNERTE